MVFCYTSLQITGIYDKVWHLTSNSIQTVHIWTSKPRMETNSNTVSDKRVPVFAAFATLLEVDNCTSIHQPTDVLCCYALRDSTLAETFTTFGHLKRNVNDSLSNVGYEMKADCSWLEWWYDCKLHRGSNFPVIHAADTFSACQSALWLQ